MPTQNLKLKIFFLAIIFGGVFGVVEKIWAACTGSSPTWLSTVDYVSVASCVSQSDDGDTINISSGAADWGDNYVSWTNKNINIIGAGIDQTVITTTARAFYVENTIKSAFRISGLTIDGNASNPYIQISSRYQNVAQWVSGWRVDHIKFDGGSSSAQTGMFILGVNWGLIDHCDFENMLSGSYELFHIEIATNYYSADSPFTYAAGYDWSLPLDWGTEKALYIEDNIFNAPNISGAGHPFDTATGGRVVFRHNTVTGGGPLMHPPKTGQIGVIKYEIYNNSFSAGSYTDYYPFTVQGGGTGVVFNNQWTGWNAPWNALNLMERRVSTDESGAPLNKCDGLQAVDGNIEGGWPCFTQVGRGPGQTSAPVYAWNNGTEVSCATGGVCNNSVNLVATGTGISDYIKSTPHSNGDVDFVNNGTTPKSDYTPYAYPHPLRDEGTDFTPPSSPIGLMVE